MTVYETAFLFDHELSEDVRKEFLGKVSGIIATFQGEIRKQDDWGMRRMSYPIDNKMNAFYTFLTYTGTRGVVEEVERNIRIFDGVIRYLTTIANPTRPAKVVAPVPVPEAVAEVAAAPEAPATPAE